MSIRPRLWPVFMASIISGASLVAGAGCNALPADLSLEPAAAPVPANHAEPAALSALTSSDVAVSTAPLVNATPKRTRTVAVMMFDIGNGAPSASAAATLLTGTGNSVTNMYREVSYGMQDWVFDILGPYTLPVKACMTIACCGPSSDQTGNGATVTSIIAGLPKKYDHYLWWYGPNSGAPGCSGGTWGDAGSPNVSKTMYCSIASMGLMAVSQELGHNLGMEHEHTLSCSGGAWADDPSTCTTNEYGSNIGFMGMGSGHPSAFHKVFEGWLSGCNGVKTGGSGKFTLLPLEKPCGGTQVLQIPMPKTRNAPREAVKFYYVELRTPFGFDTSVTRMPTVVIYAGPEFSSNSGYADHTFLISRITTAGGSFADPGGGLTITVDSLDATNASITVSGPAAGTPTCLTGGGTFTAPGPGPESCTAGVGGASGSTGGAGGASAGSGGAGSGGRAGTGGSAATGGRGGASGTGGAVGTGDAGNGGRTGTGGANGSGGASTGTGGQVVTGTGGASASGGASATGGSGTTTGTGGAGVGVDGGSNLTSNVASGCACSTNGNGIPMSGPVLGLLGMAMIMRTRKRS